MTKPTKVEGYKCLEGTIHATLLECAECNVSRRLQDFMTGDMNDKSRTFLFTTAGATGVEVARSLGPQMTALALNSENKILSHWITKQPELLETIIRHYLDEASGDVLSKIPTPQKEQDHD